MRNKKQKTALHSATNKERRFRVQLTPQERQALILVLALFFLGFFVRFFRTPPSADPNQAADRRQTSFPH